MSTRGADGYYQPDDAKVEEEEGRGFTCTRKPAFWSVISIREKLVILAILGKVLKFELLDTDSGCGKIRQERNR